MVTSQLENRVEAKACPTIAVVDDDLLFLHSVGRLLRSAGYRAAMFGSAAEFLLSLPAAPPECVLLDVHMPGMTGLQLQDHLSFKGYHLPIIFLTAFETPQSQEHAHRAGSFGLLLKPFSQEALFQAIRRAIGSQVETP